jgi:exoribonuclease R
MRADVEAAAAMSAGLERIRREAAIPDGFPDEVLAAAEAASRRPPGSEHRDRTGERFLTLDPATSTDLDQAFHIEPPQTPDADVVLHYAIADVGWFVRPGDALDVEAFERGVTVYLPDRRSTLYPTSLSEGAASLLPNQDRPAVVFTVRVAGDGAVRLDAVERALVRSHGKLAYDTVSEADLPAGFAGARPQGSSSPSSRSSATAMVTTRCGSVRVSTRRSRTRRCHWPPTSPWPRRCTLLAPACSA